MSRFGRLPLTVRIPLSVALLFLLISAALISLSLHGLSRQLDRQIEDMGQVYLDGLSAAVLPAVRARHPGQITEALNRALDTHVGVVDRTLAVFDGAGELLASVSRYPEVEPIPLDLLARQATGTLLSQTATGAWTWRALDASQPGLGMVVANLDVGVFLAQRRALAIELVVVGLTISLLGAGLAVVVARRLQRPVMLLTARLRAARGEMPRELGPDAYAHDPELADLLSAYNWMVQGMAEREGLARRQARIEREALLGRMSAALAHEIRNPLGGMRTAVQTLRQFGHLPEARRESLDFVERGVGSLQAVVDASLRTFRPEEGYQVLRAADIEDIRLLVRAQAARRSVNLVLVCAWPDDASRQLPAAPVRQLLLNLVLNAVEASPPGLEVRIHARVGIDALFIHVQDAGGGLPAAARQALLCESANDNPTVPEGRMGLVIVRELVAGLGGRIKLGSLPQGRGTRISVRLPYAGMEMS
ncbi:Sensor histidine kinase [plant metagenome]